MLGGLVAVGTACSAWSAQASTDPVSLVIPFATGGTTDLLGRIVAQRLTEALGAPVVPANRPGAGSTLGAEIVARARADGRTLLLGSTSSLALAPLTHEDLRYDPDRAFVGVGMLARAPMVLLVSRALAVRSWAELLQLGRARSEPLRLASPGHGTSLHLAGEMLCAASNLRTLHVPFQGSQPALTALMGDHVDLMLDLLPAARSAIATSRVTALATSGPSRLLMMPSTPTLVELQLDSPPPEPRFALVAPAGTPPGRLRELRRATEVAMVGQDFQPALDRAGLVELVPDGAGVMAEFRRERQVWSAFAQQRGIRLMA